MWSGLEFCGRSGGRSGHRRVGFGVLTAEKEACGHGWDVLVSERIGAHEQIPNWLLNLFDSSGLFETNFGCRSLLLCVQLFSQLADSQIEVINIFPNIFG